MDVINVFYYFGVTVRKKNKLIKKIIRVRTDLQKEKRDEDILTTETLALVCP